MERKFERDATIFENHTAESIVSVFDLFVEITGGNSKDPSEPALMFLSHYEADRPEDLEYNRGLSKTVDGDFGFSPRVWAINLNYKIAYKNEPWDIEASYRSYKRNGRSHERKLGRFYLNCINVYDNSGTPNRAEEDFLRVTKRLLEIQKERDLKVIKSNDKIDAWSVFMLGNGYVRGPQFASYEELSVWCLTNTRPHVRRHSINGYQVFFTD